MVTTRTTLYPLDGSPSPVKTKKKAFDCYHHYIPRFILRYFAIMRPLSESPKKQKKTLLNSDEIRHSNEIHFYQISTGSLQSRLISRVYGQVNLYRDENNPANVDHLETKLAILEGEACNIIRRIHKKTPNGTFTLSREELAKLRKFIFVMHYRNDAVSSQYFQEDNPSNAPISEWIHRYKESRHLKDSMDLWLAGLRYYLETPHLEIMRAGKRLRERYGERQLHDMLRRRLDPEIEEDYFAIDYESLANYFFLGVWEAADSSEFVLTGNTFGLWEGLIYDTPGAHRLYVVTPRIVLILRRTFLRQQTLSGDPSVLLSRLADIPIVPPNIKYANEKALQGLEDMDPDIAKEVHEAYVSSARASEDEFIFRITKLTREQTYAINEITMTNANLHPEGSITFLTPSIMQQTLQKYLSSHDTGDGKASLFQPLVAQLNDAPTRTGITVQILSDHNHFKNPGDMQLLQFLQYAIIDSGISFPSSYNRAYLVFHMATDKHILNNPISRAIRSISKSGISRWICVLNPAAVPVILTPRKSWVLVKTLPKAESEVFFDIMRGKVPNIIVPAHSDDVLAKVVYEAAIVGIAEWLASHYPDILSELFSPRMTVLNFCSTESKRK